MLIDDFLKLPLETRRRLLKRLIFETVPEGEVKETAHAAGLEAYTLYKMRDGNEVKYNLLRIELLDLMHIRRDLRVLDFLEALFGRIAFPRPTSLTTLPELNRQITAVLRECSEAVKAVIDSVEHDSTGGHRIGAKEMAEIEEEIREAHQHLAAMEAAVRNYHREKGLERN